MKAICEFGGKIRHYADSAAHRNRYPFFIPDSSREWTARVCPAIKISRLGTHISRKFASRYYDSVAAVVMFVPSDVAADIVKADERYFVCDSAYCIGDSVAVGVQETVHNISAGGNELIFTAESLKADEVVSQLSEYATLKMGDLIIFGDKCFNLSIKEGDTLTVRLDGEDSVEVKIK